MHLAQRLVAVCRWLYQQPELAGLTLGLMSEGNAAAAALTAARQHDAPVGALVTLGGGAAMPPAGRNCQFLPCCWWGNTMR